jgi:hypothetical protein
VCTEMYGPPPICKACQPAPKYKSENAFAICAAFRIEDLEASLNHARATSKSRCPP